MSDLEEFLRRKQDLALKTAKLHLTENDAQLLFANGDHFIFKDGETIFEEGHLIPSVFRIFSGSAHVYKNGLKLRTLMRGLFINERLVFGANSQSPFTFVANGPVELVRMDIAYVKRLFEIDLQLAIKFYRNLASKLSSLMHLIMIDVEGISQFAKCEQGDVTGKSRTSLILEDAENKAPPRLAKKLSKGPFTGHIKDLKIYQLESTKGHTTCRLKQERITIVSEHFGFHRKKKIPYRDMRATAKLTDESVTIVFIYKGHKRGKTLFFKTEHEANEMFGYISSVLSNTTSSVRRISMTEPLSSAMSLNSSSDSDYNNPADAIDFEDEKEKEQRRIEAETFYKIADRLIFKKGEVIIQEGDLYQRLYQITKGTVELMQAGKVITTLDEGSKFGEWTILHLRPYRISVRAASETTHISIIPGHKLNEMFLKNDEFSLGMYRRCAMDLDSIIERILSQKHTPVIQESVA
eukprot:TRINITY_DN10925_c0_g1_i1.p1 TRINITY_DN10925_c0_g1~~TRINITY_DN10925_c0_g1_i1.p1  ORF type:complete len:466 (-),score=86.51 TRINITY_DN10925_c0_g1_i1:20-1417(-)